MEDFFESLQHGMPIVTANEEVLSMRFTEGGIQSQMSCIEPFKLLMPYTRTMMGFLIAKSNPTSILMIGLGGGSLAKFCYRHLPNTKITVVEINPQVIALRKLFKVPLDDERLCVVRGDGVAFARSFNPGFDVILVDGFDALGQSSELSTDQFYDDCLRILPSRGLMVVNLDTAHPAHSVYVQRISRAFEGNTLEVEVAERGNSIVFAGKDDCIHSIFMNCEVVQDRLSPELRSELASEFQHITQRAMMATRNAILNVELRGFL